jgi:hypothetical protein
LCVQVQSLSGSAQVQAGTTAGFVIWVWSVGGPAQDVTVTAAVASAKNLGTPKFTVCPQTGTAACSLGNLPASQADELQATVAVGKTAAAGETVKLTATAKGTGALQDAVAGALGVTTAPPTGSPSPPPVLSLPISPIPPITLEPVLPVPGGATGLFPTVAPIPGASTPPIGFPPARKPARRSAATTASSVVPLGSRLIGGQLAGLVVLATGVAIAVARLSLRRPRPQHGPGDTGPGS